MNAPPVIRNAGYRRLLAITILNGSGTQVSLIAFPLLILWMTGKASFAGVVGATRTLGLVVGGVPAGALVDRSDPRRIMSAAATIAAITYSLISLAYATHSLNLAYLAFGGIVAGCCESAFRPASMAILRSATQTTERAEALSFYQGAQASTSLLGPPIGGILYSLVKPLPIIFDAATFFFCAMLSRGLPQLPDRPETAARPIRASLREGAAFVWNHHALRPILVTAAILNFTTTGYVLSLVITLQMQGVAPGYIGLIETAMAVTVVTGSFFSGPLLRRITGGRAATIGIGVLAGSLAGSAAISYFPTRTAVFACGWLLFPAVNSVVYAFIMSVTPEHFQGRVQSTVSTTVLALSPLAPLLAGLLIEEVGSTHTLYLFAAGALAATVPILCTNELRSIPLLSELK